MAKIKMHRLGDLQLKIMQVLWDRQEATVAQVLDDLTRNVKLAYTTVATMLRKMEIRGLVAHRVEGRTFLYRPKVAATEVSQSMAEHWVEKLFGGSLTDAVHHLLTTREVSRKELAQLERLIAERKKKL
jgi:predicted transcriptional regulator